ncbi:Rossmann-fold NAD(P)-binding domain-containing protein [Leptospira chreensis]|uniref:hypothetical protein n=1 Tax=Leptospira chreensis TaxID=2810035 RepID=UPI002FC9CC95
MITEEIQFLNESSFEKFRNEIDDIKSKLIEKLLLFKSKGFTLCGYGGGLKAATLLNWLAMPDLEYTVDKDPYKVGKFIPGLNLPILEVGTLETDETKKVMINLAINFNEEVESSLFSLLKNGDIIVHVFPEMKFVEINK